MSKKIERKDRHFKFETLQLHVGQESPDLIGKIEEIDDRHALSGKNDIVLVVVEIGRASCRERV